MCNNSVIGALCLSIYVLILKYVLILVMTYFFTSQLYYYKTPNVAIKNHLLLSSILLAHATIGAIKLLLYSRLKCIVIKNNRPNCTNTCMHRKCYSDTVSTV